MNLILTIRKKIAFALILFALLVAVGAAKLASVIDPDYRETLEAKRI